MTLGRWKWPGLKDHEPFPGEKKPIMKAQPRSIPPQMKKDFNERVLVDFDKTIHAFSKGTQDGTIYDNPLPGSFEALSRLDVRGFRITIFTARPESQSEEIRAWVAHWQGMLHIHFKFDVDCSKPPAAIYIDDKRFHFTDWLRDYLAIDEQLDGQERV